MYFLSIDYYLTSNWSSYNFQLQLTIGINTWAENIDWVSNFVEIGFSSEEPIEINQGNSKQFILTIKSVRTR